MAYQPPELAVDPVDPEGDAPYVPPVGSIQSGITSRAIAHSSAPMPTNDISRLNITGNTVSAIIHLEAAETAVEGAVLARYWMDGSYPTANEGFPIKAGEKIEIKGYANIVNARFISVDGLAHVLQIQYFS